jgi:hypothetical protein
MWKVENEMKTNNFFWKRISKIENVVVLLSCKHFKYFHNFMELHILINKMHCFFHTICGVYFYILCCLPLFISMLWIVCSQREELAKRQINKLQIGAVFNGLKNVDALAILKKNSKVPLGNCPEQLPYKAPPIKLVPKVDFFEQGQVHS